MMPTRWFASAALALAVAAGCVLCLDTARAQAPARPQAQSQSANPNPSPAAIAMAREIITLKGAHQMFDAVVPGVIETAKNQFLPTNPNLNKELNEVAALLHRDFDAKKTEMLNEVARAYARHFNEQELKELIAFYKTALGKKLLVEEPLAIDDGIRRAREWADAFADQVVNRMRAEMKKKGFDL